ncbi:alternative splicing factor SRp20/9G8-like protein [Dinothrombium tinctorium]|uniref:Alternative splicing factor SRp20/9G8-like protein n=1 Tax=Dinothrombium tinctorium TaxID=1965070 RepID=A0A3S4QYY2_9ACAR|nr:alternative splicing factor SRp20/9G8-like protein [Dinothrombium tinctorium]RWS09926.1 alternative splicing factor SRp20/9G8-like protein [Dinothrombium tinctorium]RWS11988.1 alternative splicing factor SRp20/9G8-like protein [Dinothrombium tinctorium]
MTYGRVFIGGISGDVTKEQIEREFGKYGKLNSVWVAQNPPGFAFVEFDDNRDAEEAVKQLNGQALFDDNKIRVEHSNNRREGGRGGRGGFRGRGMGSPRGGGYSSPGYRGGGRGGGYKPSNRFNDRPRGGGRYDRGNGSGSGGSSRYGSSGGGRDRYDGGSFGGNYHSYRSRSPFGQSAGGRRYYCSLMNLVFSLVLSVSTVG